jgi:hypothetical protein
MKLYVLAAVVVALAIAGVATAASVSVPTKTVHHLCVYVDPRGGATLHDLDTHPNQRNAILKGGLGWKRLCIAGLRGKRGPTGTGEQGPKGDTGATGATGATGPEGPAELESSRSCIPNLCVDADPASGGSSGWGFDPVANAPVSDLKVGQTYPFTATVVQDNGEVARGSITVTWNPNDFQGPTAGSDSSASCATASTGNALSCTYTDLAHQYKSDTFNFTALHANPAALVEVTVQNCKGQASGLFPVEISG